MRKERLAAKFLFAMSHHCHSIRHRGIVAQLRHQRTAPRRQSTAPRRQRTAPRRQRTAPRRQRTQLPQHRPHRLDI